MICATRLTASVQIQSERGRRHKDQWFLAGTLITGQGACDITS